MTFENHNRNQCDKCGKEVGEDNLTEFPFLYLDCNDVAHKDKGKGYRQYYGCKECIELEKRLRS
jgi:hypothetical protein